MSSSTARTRTLAAKPRSGPPTDAGARWRSVEDAAAFLGMPVRVLREALASNARLDGGVTEAHLDGIIARKLGRRWRVWLAEKWTAPEPATAAASRHGRVPTAVDAGHAGRKSTMAVIEKVRRGKRVL